MFNFLRGPVQINNDSDVSRMVIRQGYNKLSDDYFISITDRHTRITFRVNMTKQAYDDFHKMSNFTAEQTRVEKLVSALHDLIKKWDDIGYLDAYNGADFADELRELLGEKRDV